MEKPYISILTPTYNRANLLARVFESLQSQTDKDFEWIIVDDGSTDNTKSTVEEFQKKSSFPIEYYLKKNGGKHTAINLGISKAKGDFTLILDTDDQLTPEAISLLKKSIQEIDNDSVVAVATRRINPDGSIVGSGNFEKITSNSLDIRYKHNITGDLVEVFKTDILQEYTFPEIEGEKFCPEALIWNRIAQKYKIDFYNYGFYVTEYLPGGLTDKIVKIRMNSPKASMIHYSELASYNIPLKEKIKATINFWRFSFNDKDWGFKNKLSRVNFLYSLVGFPLGFAMYLNDRRKNK
ncbi:glycosyltransferase family 2 protein [Ornithobacterium rhinotracheale]|uniref:glycosyltransferase family 2 protein n=1 Tax=Ornithobacterium rhinotracheale TaxID=28251 RepID=UPI0040366140